MRRILTACAIGATVLLGARVLPAASLTIDFENLPALAAQPSTFAAAGAMQTYSNANFSITGGVVLGNPAFLAGFAANGSQPNLYGTADFADPSLLDTLTLTFPSAENINTVSGLLFNGQSIAESYTVTVMSGATILSVLNLNNIPAASSTSDFLPFSITSGSPITSLAFTTPNSGTNGWDFFVDTIHASTVPEPGSLLLLLGGGLFLGALRLKKIG